MGIGAAGALLTLLALEQKVALLFAQMHQRHQYRAWHRHAVGVLKVIAAIARQICRPLAQGSQHRHQWILRGGRWHGRGRNPRTDQPSELLRRQPQFVVLDAKKVADALEVIRRWLALPTQVLVELRPVDHQQAANLGNRAVMAASKFKVDTKKLTHDSALKWCDRRNSSIKLHQLEARREIVTEYVSANHAPL